MREEFEKLSATGKIQSRQIDTLVRLTEFGYCTHKSWGFGKITKLDTIESRFLIDFESKPGHSMDLGFGANILTPIAPDHILVRKSNMTRIRKASQKLEKQLGRDPSSSELARELDRTEQDVAVMKQDEQSLRKMAALNHVELIKLVLKSFGGAATGDQIKDVLVPDVIEEDWRKWWDSVRKQLKKDGHFRIPLRKTDPIVLNEESVSIDQRLMEEIRKARGLKAKIPFAAEMCKSHEDFSSPEQVFKEAVGILDGEIERLRGKKDPQAMAVAVAGIFVRDDLVRLAGLEPPPVDLHSRCVWYTEKEQRLEQLRQGFVESRIDRRDRIEKELTEIQKEIERILHDLEEAKSSGNEEKEEAHNEKLAETRRKAGDLQQSFGQMVEETDEYDRIQSARQKVGSLEWELEECPCINAKAIGKKLEEAREDLGRFQEKLEKASGENNPNAIARFQKKVSVATGQVAHLEKFSSTFQDLDDARKERDRLLEALWERLSGQQASLEERIDEVRAEIQEARSMAEASRKAPDTEDESAGETSPATRKAPEMDEATRRKFASLEDRQKRIRNELQPLQRISEARQAFEESLRKSVELQETMERQWEKGEEGMEEMEKILEKIPSLHPVDNVRIAAILESLPAVRHKRALQSYQAARREDWTIAILGIINRVNARLVNECASVLVANWDLSLLKKALEQKINQHWASTDLLLWLSQYKTDSFDDILGPEVFRSMIAALERDQINENKSSRLKDYIMTEIKLLDRLFEKADRETINDLTRTLQLSSCFEDMDKRSLLARILKSFPFIQSLISGEAGTRERGIIVSPASMERRKQEYEELVHKKIPLNSKEIAVARSYGDLRENHEFKAAKEMQRLLLARKAELEEELARAAITRFEDIDSGSVNIGTVVQVTDLNRNAPETYTILGAWDSDPDQDVISYLSPLAQALLHQPPGKEIVLEQPDKRKLRIDQIEPISPSQIEALTDTEAKAADKAPAEESGARNEVHS